MPTSEAGFKMAPVDDRYYIGVTCAHCGKPSVRQTRKGIRWRCKRCGERNVGPSVIEALARAHSVKLANHSHTTLELQQEKARQGRLRLRARELDQDG